MRCHAAGVCSFSFNPSSPARHRCRPAVTAIPPSTTLPHSTCHTLDLRFAPLLHPLAQAPRSLNPPLSPIRHFEPPPVPSKPDRPTLIDLLISTIVLYLPARTSSSPTFSLFYISFSLSIRLPRAEEGAILRVTNDFYHVPPFFFLSLQDFPRRANSRFRNLRLRSRVEFLSVDFIYTTCTMLRVTFGDIDSRKIKCV